MDSEPTIFFQKYKFYVYIVIVGIAIYFNGLFGTFVWDDIYQIQNNVLVHSVSNIMRFFLGSTFTPLNSSQLGGLYYRPLMSLAFSLVYTFFGTTTFPYHLLQVSIHIANALLVFYLFKRFFKDALSFFLSLVFLVHPINVESVVYIATLEEPLFFLFGISALILFLKERMSIKRYSLVLLLLVASIFSKETGVLFSLLILFYYFLFKKKTVLDTVKTVSIVIIQIAFYLFMRFAIAKVYVLKIPDVTMMTATPLERLLTMPAIFLFYIKTFFFPIQLFIYQEWMVSRPDWNFFFPLILDIFFLSVLCAIGLWLWKAHKRYIVPYFFFAVWFSLGIGFHLQLLPLDMTVADHMFYFPMIGLLGMTGLLLQNIKVSNHVVHNTGIFLAIALIGFFSVRTIIRNTNWYNGIALYSNDLQYQQNDRIENLLATELFQAGQYAEAQKYFEELLSREPHEPALVFNLAMIYESESNLPKAENLYKTKLPVDDVGILYSNYARVLMKEGKVQQAKEVSSLGLSKFPQNTTLILIDAIASYKLGNKQAALQEVQQAEKLLPDPRIEQIYQSMQNDTLTI